MNDSQTEKTQSEQIDAIILNLGDWRSDKLNRIRILIKQADPKVIEEVKWKKAANPDGIPVWSHDGMICTGEFYKNHLRLTFPKAASLKDTEGLFNVYRGIVIHEGDKIDETAFKNLISSVVELNHENKIKKKT